MKQITAHKCDYCGKLYQRESFCFLHEKDCYKNPANYQSCVSCLNLEISERKFIGLRGYHAEEYTGTTKRFYCKAKQIDLHSRQIESKPAFRSDEYFESTVKMPMSCEMFSDSLQDLTVPF